jgi:hypothetical protein
MLQLPVVQHSLELMGCAQFNGLTEVDETRPSTRHRSLIGNVRTGWPQRALPIYTNGNYTFISLLTGLQLKILKAYGHDQVCMPQYHALEFV